MRVLTAEPAASFPTSPRGEGPDAFYARRRPYRLVFNERGDFSSFPLFGDVLSYLAFTKVKAVAIINDDRTDGGKRQGLTEDEYLAALEVCS